MKYADSHEWIELEEKQQAIVGISQFAQKELGDIVFVELPTVGKEVIAGQEIAVLESTKSAADIYSPVSGKILSVNEDLLKSPELVNQFPENKGWIFKIQLSQPAELDQLMDFQAYQDMLNGA